MTTIVKGLNMKYSNAIPPFKLLSHAPQVYSISLQPAFIFAVMSTHVISAVQGAAHYNNTGHWC